MDEVVTGELPLQREKMKEKHSLKSRAGLRVENGGRENARAKKLHAMVDLGYGATTVRDLDGVDSICVNDGKGLDVASRAGACWVMRSKYDKEVKGGECLGNEGAS